MISQETLVPSILVISVDWYATLGGDNVIQILPAQEIINHAQATAEAGLPVTVCPYPADSAHANRWRLAFYAREKELRAEVEA
jgi:hypothetical protein